MEAVDAMIQRTTRDIERVEREIEAADGELRRVDPSDGASLQYWRKEKEQLRKEKEQLRDKEEQLREEKMLLLQRPETPVSLAPRFIELLKKGTITRPNDAVIAKILTSFISELRSSLGSVDSAEALYRRIRELPTTLTMCVVQDQAGVRIMGPLRSDKPKILTGRRRDGTAIVVKLLNLDNDDVRPVDLRLEEMENEAKCCEELAAVTVDTSIALVRHEVVTLQVPEEFVLMSRRRDSFKALLMTRYVESLARGGVYALELVAREASRVTAALKFMHYHRYVHMDVKGDNVFVDNSGAWFLGDFGSACKIGEPIRTSTPTFYHCDMGGRALAKYDWFMLLVLILVELDDKNKWSERLVVSDERRVSYDMVMFEADKAMSNETIPQELRSTIAEVKDLYLSASMNDEDSVGGDCNRAQTL